MLTSDEDGSGAKAPSPLITRPIMIIRKVNKIMINMKLIRLGNRLTKKSYWAILPNKCDW